MSCCAADTATAMPARTEPVIETRPRAGFSTNVAPVPPLPSTTLNTPSGRMPFESFARTSVLPGVVSLGLRTIVLPAARAGDLPQRHHERVVPGRDLTDDADRLTTDVGGETLHVLSGRLALEVVRLRRRTASDRLRP